MNMSDQKSSPEMNEPNEEGDERDEPGDEQHEQNSRQQLCSKTKELDLESHSLLSVPVIMQTNMSQTNRLFARLFNGSDSTASSSSLRTSIIVAASSHCLEASSHCLEASSHCSEASSHCLDSSSHCLKSARLYSLSTVLFLIERDYCVDSESDRAERVA